MRFSHKWYTMPLDEKKLLLKATFLCIGVKLMILLLPMKYYARLLGKQNKMDIREQDDSLNKKILLASRAIIRTRKIIPWKSQCLTEAIAAKILLQRMGVPSTLYLGVKKINEQMDAHAWVRCGNAFVTGRRGSEQFVVVSTFS